MVRFKSDEKLVTVTNALPYIHGIPHLGNVAAFLPADIFHRYLDIKGTRNVYVCGGDVHGTPLELEALKRNVPPEELKEKQNKKVEKALKDLNFDFSLFSNTDSEYNKKQTYEMFEELYCKGFIEEKTQVMPYCLNDERFLPDRYIEGECPYCGGLARGDQCDDCGRLVEPEELKNPECQICGEKEIEFRDTTHLFLKLKPFKKKLMEWLNSDPTPIPDNLVKEVENLIKDAEERAITRDQEWGFEVPVERVNKRIEEENLEVPSLDPETFDNKVLYVWFDAPIGYIGFTRELFEGREEWKDYWLGDKSKVYYSIGKDNTIFHTVIFPAMLIGSSNKEREYNLPHYEFIQQFLMWNGQAFSKSRGIGVWADEATDLFPAGYWRFYIARNLPQNQDTNFSWENFENEINSVLNDTVGNFINRTLALSEKWFDNEVPEPNLTRKDKEILDQADKLAQGYSDSFQDHNLKKALDKSLEVARLGDSYLSEEEPWNNEERREEVVYTALKLIRGLSILLYPFIPSKSAEIAGMLHTEINTNEGVNELENLFEKLQPGHELGKRKILFEKIDTSEHREE